jgi:hypothetical protein
LGILGLDSYYHNQAVQNSNFESNSLYN